MQRIAALKVDGAGSRLTVTFGSETLSFVDAGPPRGAGTSPQPPGPGWVPVPPAALEGADPALIGVRWVLYSLKSGTRTTTFDRDDAVDLHLYGDASLGLSELCSSRSSSWRPAGHGFRIIAWHNDFVTCATRPAAAVVDTGWPAVTALVGAGPLVATVTGHTLTIVHDGATFTFLGDQS